MQIDSIDSYRSLYRTAFLASLAMLLIIPIQIVVFVLNPMPTSTVGWFDLFNKNALVGFFHADLFLLVNNILISIIYLAFYHLLKGGNKGLLQIALLFGFIGIASYISSNKTFEFLSLATEYGATTSESERLVLLAAGKSLLVGWQGTAFDTYYVLNGIALLIISMQMFGSPHFTRVSASFGLASGILMCIPSTAGTLGLVFSLLSLIPWYVFTIMFARVFRTLGKRTTVLS